MRSFVADYEMRQMESLEKTLELLQTEPKKWKVFAGGTDLMVQFEMGKLQNKAFLDLSPFDELKKIEFKSDENGRKYLSLGALCTYSQIQTSPEIKNAFPILAQAGFLTGAVAIQNRGTIGGNIANASPAADSLPALLVYDADIILTSAQGKRRLKYQNFHSDYKKMDLRAGEIIESVELPMKTSNCHLYKKIGTRAFQSIAKVSVAIAADVRRGEVQYLKAAYSSVGPVPILFQQLESEYLNKNVSTFSQSRVRDLVQASFRPLDDIRSTAEYRKKVIENITWDFLNKIKENPDGILHLEK